MNIRDIFQQIGKRRRSGEKRYLRLLRTVECRREVNEDTVGTRSVSIDSREIKGSDHSQYQKLTLRA